MSQNPPTRKKNKAVKTNPLLFVFIIFILILVTGFYFFKSSKTSRFVSPSPFSTTRTFHSSILKFTIELPIEYKITEKSIRVTLEKNGNQIVIDKSVTNFLTLEEYVTDLKIKNKGLRLEEKYLKINNNDVFVQIIKTGENTYQKNYKIYIDRSIYDVSCDFKELWKDLDQIAQSFRYAPD